MWALLRPRSVDFAEIQEGAIEPGALCRFFNQVVSCSYREFHFVGLIPVQYWAIYMRYTQALPCFRFCVQPLENLEKFIVVEQQLRKSNIRHVCCSNFGTADTHKKLYHAWYPWYERPWTLHNTPLWTHQHIQLVPTLYPPVWIPVRSPLMIYFVFRWF